MSCACTHENISWLSMSSSLFHTSFVVWSVDRSDGVDGIQSGAWIIFLICHACVWLFVDDDHTGDGVLFWLLSMNAAIILFVTVSDGGIVTSSPSLIDVSREISPEGKSDHHPIALIDPLAVPLPPFGILTVGREKNVIRGISGLCVRKSIFLISCISTMRSKGLSSSVLLI